MAEIVTIRRNAIFVIFLVGLLSVTFLPGWFASPSWAQGVPSAQREETPSSGTEDTSTKASYDTSLVDLQKEIVDSEPSNSAFYQPSLHYPSDAMMKSVPRVMRLAWVGALCVVVLLAMFTWPLSEVEALCMERELRQASAAKRRIKGTLVKEDDSEQALTVVSRSVQVSEDDTSSAVPLVADSVPLLHRLRFLSGGTVGESRLASRGASGVAAEVTASGVAAKGAPGCKASAVGAPGGNSSAVGAISRNASAVGATGSKGSAVGATGSNSSAVGATGGNSSAVGAISRNASAVGATGSNSSAVGATGGHAWPDFDELTPSSRRNPLSLFTWSKAARERYLPLSEQRIASGLHIIVCDVPIKQVAHDVVLDLLQRSEGCVAVATSELDEARVAFALAGVEDADREQRMLALRRNSRLLSKSLRRVLFTRGERVYGAEFLRQLERSARQRGVAAVVLDMVARYEIGALPRVLEVEAWLNELHKIATHGNFPVFLLAKRAEVVDSCPYPRYCWEELVVEPAKVESGPAKGESGPAKGESGSAKGESGSAKGESGSAKGESGHAKGESGHAKGEFGHAKGEFGSAKVESGPAKGESGPAKGESELAKGEPNSEKDEVGAQRASE